MHSAISELIEDGKKVVAAIAVNRGGLIADPGWFARELEARLEGDLGLHQACDGAAMAVTQYHRAVCTPEGGLAVRQHGINVNALRETAVARISTLERLASQYEVKEWVKSIY